MNMGKSIIRNVVLANDKVVIEKNQRSEYEDYGVNLIIVLIHKFIDFGI